MALYEDTKMRRVRDWIKKLDNPTLTYLIARLYKQTRVVKRNDKIVRIVRFGEVIKMLQDESGVMSQGLTRSAYISHEASDILMRAILGVLDNNHLQQEPRAPILFREFENFLLNDVAGSQLFATNRVALKYKYGTAKPCEEEKRHPIRHRSMNEEDELGQLEGEVTQVLGGNGDIEDDLTLMVVEARKRLRSRRESLTVVFDLLLQGKAVKEIAKKVKRCKSTVYMDVSVIKRIIAS